MTANRDRPQSAAGTLPRFPDRSVAGLLLLIAGVAVVLGIMTAEALYPADYDVHRNTVSDLAAMRPEDIVRQPSAATFNTTMIITGALIVIAAVLLYRSRAGLLATLPVSFVQAIRSILMARTSVAFDPASRSSRGGILKRTRGGLSATVHVNPESAEAEVVA